MNNESRVINNPQILGEVVGRIDSLPWTHAVYLPNEKPYDLQTSCMVLNPEDSEGPEEEPDQAKQHGLKYGLSVATIQDIVANAKAQNQAVTTADLIKAFNFYYNNDAFVVL